MECFLTLFSSWLLEQLKICLPLFNYIIPEHNKSRTGFLFAWHRQLDSNLIATMVSHLIMTCWINFHFFLLRHKSFRYGCQNPSWSKMENHFL